MHYAYTYRDPRESKGNVAVYVGKGTGRRAYEHWEKHYRCKNNRLRNFLNVLRKNSLVPVIDIVYEFGTEKEALMKEVELISLLGRADTGKGPLFNNTDGGEGFINLGSKALKQRSASIKKVYSSPDARSRQRDQAIASWRNEAYRNTRVEQMRKMSQDPEYQEKLSESIRVAHSRPEVRERKSKVTKDRWDAPGGRETFIEAMTRGSAVQEVKDRRGSATKAGWENKEIRRKRTEGIRAAQTPEMIARRAKSNKDVWTEDKRKSFSDVMRKVCSDPAHKKKRSEAAKKAWEKRKICFDL